MPQSLNMTEGGDPMKFKVGLNMPWSTDITVSLVSANPNVAMTIPENLTFPAGTMAPKDVQVFAPVDDDTVGNTTSINVFAPETGQLSVTVNVTDPDVQGLLVSPAKVMMTEGRTENFLVRLAKKPASAVVVTLTCSNPDKLTLGSTSLTFNAGDYSLQQSVPLMALLDADALAENVTITLTATGNFQNVTVPVQITDIDAVNLDVSPSSLNLTERADMPGTISVALTKAPPSDVNVTVESSKGDKVTVMPGTLTFTSVNYATPQTVKVAAVSDNDTRDEAATITLKGSGITPAPMDRTVAVTVKDVDSQSLVVSPLSTTVYEGAMKTFTVQMALQPDGDTTVNVYSQNEGKLRVNPPVLHFNQSNFTMPQTVSVEGVPDDDLANENVNVTLIGASVAKATTVAVTVMDDDVQAIQFVPASALVTQESRPTGAASTTSIGVRLAFRPSTSVAVTVVSSDPTLLAPGTTLVSFDALNYATPQFVTYTAKHDADTADNMVTVTASATGLPDAKLPVNIVDTDVQNFDIALTSISLTESSLPTPMGTMVPLVVKLTSQPSKDVTVSFASTLPLTGPGAKLAMPTSCTIVPATAMTTGCTVDVGAVPDNDRRDETGIITISATVDGVPLTQRTVAVTIKDNDIQSLVLSKTDLGTIVEGSMASFDVTLALNPIDAVTVGVSSNDPHFSVSPSTLTFNAGDYGTPHPVTVKAVDDQDMDSYLNKTITVEGAGAGAGTATVNVSGMNNDKQAIITTFPAGSTLSVMEGSSYQVGVRLTYKPVSTETVTVTSSDATRLTVAGSAMTDLTFAGDYSAFRYVTLTSLADLTMGDHLVTVTTESSLKPATPSATPVTVAIPDIDTLNFLLSPDTTGPIPEGTSVAFHVKLTIKPAAPIIVSIGATPSACSSTTPIAASFSGSATCALSDSSAGSSGNDCLLTVQACEDANALPENVSITISGGGGIASRTLTLSTIDNDMQGLLVTGPATQTGTTVNEGDPAAQPPIPSGTTTFSVALKAQPAADTQIMITTSPSLTDGIKILPVAPAPVPPMAALPPDATILTFTPSNYATPQAVTVVGVPDKDLRTDPFSIRISAASLSVTDSFVSVTETDDNTQQIVLTATTAGACPNPTTQPELPGTPMVGTTVEPTDTSPGIPAQFCVSLKYQPLSNTVLNVDLASGVAPVSPSNIPMSFLTSDYFVPRLASFQAQSDNDARGESGRLVNLSSSGFAATRSVTFDVTDSTPMSLVFSPTPPVSLAAGGSGTIKMALSFDPITTASVTCTTTSPVTIMPGSYSFTGGGNGSGIGTGNGNWKVAQSIQLSVADPAAPGSVAVSCSALGQTPSPAAPVVGTFSVNVQ